MVFLFHFYDLHRSFGIQRAICELANVLVSSGDRVVIATHTNKSDIAFQLDRRVTLVQTPYAEPNIYGPCGWITRALWGFREIAVLGRIIKDYHPDLVVDHGTALGLMYPFRKMHNIPFILQRHFPVKQFPHGKVLYRAMSYISSRKRIIALTDKIRDEFCAIGYKNVGVIPNVIPAMARHVSYKRAVEKTGLLMGRATPQKGFDIFLEALAQIDMPGWHFSIVGAGCDTDMTLIGLIDKHSLSESVSLYPATTNPYKWIEKSSCVIVPSRYEGLPMVAIEALSIGRPIIASDANGLRDIVVPYVNGIVFPRNNIHKLSECMTTIRDNPRILCMYANNAYKGISALKTDAIIDKWHREGALS